MPFAVLCETHIYHKRSVDRDEEVHGEEYTTLTPDVQLTQQKSIIALPDELYRPRCYN